MLHASVLLRKMLWGPAVKILESTAQFYANEYDTTIQAAYYPPNLVESKLQPSPIGLLTDSSLELGMPFWLLCRHLIGISRLAQGYFHIAEESLRIGIEEAKMCNESIVSRRLKAALSELLLSQGKAADARESYDGTYKVHLLSFCYCV